MKNFWLRRHRSRQMNERIEQINKIAQGIVNGKLIQKRNFKGKTSWPQKNGIKTQP